MGSGYYPGLPIYDESAGRREVRRAQHRQDLFSVLASVPGLINAFGAVRQASDQEANDRLFAQRMQEAIANPRGDMPAGQYGPAEPPDVATANEAASTPDESFFHRLGRTMSLGAFGDYQPHLGGQQVMQVSQAAAAGREQQDLNAYRAAQIGLDTERNRNEMFWRRIQAQNDAIARRRAGRQQDFEEQKWKEGASGRAANEAEALAHARSYDALANRPATPGMSQTAVETKYTTWLKAMNSIQGKLAAFANAAADKEFGPMRVSALIDQYGTTPEVLQEQLKQAQDNAARFAPPKSGDGEAPAGGPPNSQQSNMTPGPLGDPVHAARTRYDNDPEVKDAVDKWAQANSMKTDDLSDADWLLIATHLGYK